MSRRLKLLAALLPALLGPQVIAQCQAQWSSNLPQPEMTGSPRCTTTWDPDGAGPLPLRLVAGGSSLMAGATFLGNTYPSTQRVMTWDGSTWEPLGSGPGDGTSGSVDAVVEWNGQLIAGGSFSGPGGINSIARWDGTAWLPLASGFPMRVVALANWNGLLVAAGYTASGSVTTPTLKTWNGIAWTSLPTPPSLGEPMAMLSFEGELIVAGSNSSSSSQGALVRWNGTTWAAPIAAQSPVLSLAVRFSLAVGGSDTLFASGAFTSIGGASIAKVAKTNGGPSFTWSAVGSGLTNTVYHLQVRNSGLTDYVLVGLQGNVSTPVIRYLSSNGTWSPMGTSMMNQLVHYSGTYHGVSTWAGEPRCQRYDGTNWVSVVGPGITGEVHAVTRSGDDVVIGGTFATISGVTVNGIAKWDGSTFTPLGTGMVGSSIDALVTLDNGDIVAGGNFVAAGGVACNHVARWNGSTWSAMGNGFDAPVYALCKMPNGDVVAGGAFTQEVGAPLLSSHVSRWNGTSWSPMHFGMNNDVLALAVRGDGTLIAGGRFTQTMSTMFSLYYVARWTGTQWAGLGAGMNGAVHGLAVRPNDEIVAVGEFTQASLQNVDRIARWNGSTWTTMGAASGTAGPVHAVAGLPNGDVVAGRGFHQPASAADSGLSRWNGTTWSGLSFLANTVDPVDVRTIVQRPSGELVLGGRFQLAGMTPSFSLATLRSDCMPTASTYGTGCSSAAGLLEITADTLPWIGAAFRTTTTGVAPGSFCLGLIGLTQVSIPLPLLLGEGQPGCSLLTSLDILLALAPGPGNTATSSFAFANDPSLVGVPFFQQTIPFEFDALGTLVAVRGSNALSLVIGTL